MKKLIITLITLIIGSSALAATPTITNVSGTVATGQTLTITGTNMIQEVTTNWDSAFKSGTTYGFEGSSYSADGWMLPGDINSSAPAYDSTVKLSGNKSVKFRISGARAAGPGGLTSYLYRGSGSQDIWIRGYVKLYSANNLWATSHAKMIDWQGTGTQVYFQPGPSSSLPVNMITTYDGANHSTSAQIGSDDTWHLFELHWKSTSPRVYTTYWDNVQVGNASPSSIGSMSYILLGFINAAGTTSGFDATYWFDNFAVSSSRIYPSSTIEISGDGTTWKYQYPVFLSETSSQIKVNLSGVTGTNYRLRVTNNQQQTSAIYSLSGGGDTGGDTQAPSTPSNLTATAMSSNQINLSWPASTDNTGVTGYKVYRGGTHIATPTGTSYSNTGLSASTSYSYKVSAIDAAGNESSQSVTATATTQSTTVTDTTAPSTPAGLSASAASSTQINLSWTASTDNVGVTGYRIYRGGTYLATSTSTSYSNTGLTASTTYSYRVSAIDAAGNESSQSTATSATTQAGTVSGTVLFQESFENSSFSERGWYDNTNHGTIVSGGQSGNSLQWAWAQGATAPTNGASLRKKFTPTESLYVSFYVKFQTGWRGSQQTYHPHMILIPSNLDSDYTPLANNYLNTYVSFISDVGSPYTIRPQISIQDQLRVNTTNGTPPNNLTAVTENRSVAYCNTPVPSGATGICYADNPYYSANTWKASTASVSTNVWHLVEVYFKMNSISGGKGQSNGIMQKWVDGNLVINRSDVLYRTNQDATKKWAQFVFAPWIGDGSPIAQTMWLDELTVATAPPSAGGDTQAPAVPASLSASAVSSSQINLSWPASTDNVAVTGYKIYRGGTYLATSAGTSYSNTGLAASTSYSYKVSAIDAAGNESSQSVAATATTQAPPDTTAPSVPSGLSANATSTSQINLSWTASTDNVAVTGYKIYRGGTNIGTSTGTTYSDTGLTAATSYSYKVSAIDAAGNESSQSAAASATTQTPPDTTAPSTPSGLSANATSSSQINLSWTASTDNVGVTGYKIYRGGTNIGTSTGTSYSNTGLTANTSYSYKVSAIDAAGNESSQSTTATATTQAAAGGTDTTAPSTPSGLTANAASSSEITLSWTASTDNVGVTGYKIYRGGTYVAASTGTSYTNPALTASTSYSYSVSAIDAAGNESSKSTTATATTLAEETGDEALFQETFENSNFSARGWYDNTSHGTIVSGGQSGNCLQWAWAQGATLPANGASMRMKFTPTDSLYVSFYVKFQSGWRGSQKTYHPHMILIPSDLDSDYTPLANNYLNTYIEYISDVGSPYAIRPVLAIQDQKRVNTTSGTPPNNLTAVTENRSVAYCNTPVPSGATGVCYADNPYYSANTWKESTASVPANAWQHVEVYLKMNSISGGKGQSDGIMQQWINGSLVIDRSDVLYRTNQDATKKWAQFVFAPWIGDGSPIAQTMWLDELTVSTSPPFSSTLSPPAGFSVQEQ